MKHFLHTSNPVPKENKRDLNKSFPPTAPKNLLYVARSRVPNRTVKYVLDSLVAN